MIPELIGAIAGGGIGAISRLFGGDDSFELGNINDLAKYGIKAYDPTAAKNNLGREGQSMIARNRANKMAYLKSQGIDPRSASSYADDRSIYDAIMGQYNGIDQYANEDQLRRLGLLQQIKSAEYAGRDDSSIFDDILGGAGLGLQFGGLFGKKLSRKTSGGMGA